MNTESRSKRKVVVKVSGIPSNKRAERLLNKVLIGVNSAGYPEMEQEIKSNLSTSNTTQEMIKYFNKFSFPPEITFE